MADSRGHSSGWGLVVGSGEWVVGGGRLERLQRLVCSDAELRRLGRSAQPTAGAL